MSIYRMKFFWKHNILWSDPFSTDFARYEKYCRNPFKRVTVFEVRATETACFYKKIFFLKDGRKSEKFTKSFFRFSFCAKKAS